MAESWAVVMAAAEAVKRGARPVINRAIVI